MGKMKVQKHFELNECLNSIYQKYHDADKIVLREKFIVLNPYVRKKKESVTLVTSTGTLRY